MADQRENFLRAAGAVVHRHAIDILNKLVGVSDSKLLRSSKSQKSASKPKKFLIRVRHGATAMGRRRLHHAPSSVARASAFSVMEIKLGGCERKKEALTVYTRSAYCCNFSQFSGRVEMCCIFLSRKVFSSRKTNFQDPIFRTFPVPCGNGAAPATRCCWTSNSRQVSPVLCSLWQELT